MRLFIGGLWVKGQATRHNRKAAFEGGLSSSSTSILAEWVHVFSTARIDRAHADRACLLSSLAGAVQMLSTVRAHRASSECWMLKMASQQGRRRSKAAGGARTGGVGFLTPPTKLPRQLGIQAGYVEDSCDLRMTHGEKRVLARRVGRVRKGSFSASC